MKIKWPFIGLAGLLALSAWLAYTVDMPYLAAWRVEVISTPCRSGSDVPCLLGVQVSRSIDIGK